MTDRLFRMGDLVQWEREPDPQIVWSIIDDGDQSYLKISSHPKEITQWVQHGELTLIRAIEDLHALETEPIPETPDHHKVTIVSFQGAIEREIKRVVERFRLLDSIHSYEIQVEARGNVDEDNTEISYRVSTGYDSSVKANTMDAAVDEYMRRKGWSTSNEIKQIPMRSIPT